MGDHQPGMMLKGSSDPATWQQSSWACSMRFTIGLGSGTEIDIDVDTPWRCGQPVDVPLGFHDPFHPNLSEYPVQLRRRQSDSLPEYTIDDSGDESDDIVGYDLTELVAIPLVADRDQSGMPRSMP